MARTLAWTLALALLPAAPAAAAPEPPLQTSGRWLVDAGGRAVITHGVNMVYKRPPYIPSKTGFGADDAAFLRRHGFNSVRLGTIYTAVEPQPGRYDDAYLDAVAETERLLARGASSPRSTSTRTSTMSASAARASRTGPPSTTACRPSR